MSNNPGQLPNQNSASGRKRTYVTALWMRKILSRNFPLLYFRRHVRSSLEWNSKRDPAINEDTTPGPDEFIQLHHLWAVEFYTPSHAQHLASAFSTLGWDKSASDENKLSNWLKKSRLDSGGGGYINLGFIHPPGTRRLSFGLDRIAPLPSNVEYATAHLFNLTSSLTSLAVGFVFKQEQRRAFDTALREKYATYAAPVPGGFSIRDPRSQKLQKIFDAREEIRSAVQKWFREYAPGIFSGSGVESDIPTCEFLTFRKAIPFQSDSQGTCIDSYLDILDMRHNWDCWIDKEYPGLFFGWPLTRNRDRCHSILAINEDSYSQYKLEAYGGANTASYIGFIDLDIKTFLTRWGCLQLLHELERRLNRLRDANSFRSLRSDPVKLLKGLRSDISDSIDIAVLSPELADFASDRGMFEYEMPNFSSARKDRTPVHLTKAFKSAITRISERLALTDRTVKDLLIQQANLVSATENLKLQRRIGLLTITLTILTLLLAYAPIIDAIKSAIDLLGRVAR